MKFAIQNCMTEFSFVSGKSYTDPFNEVQLEVAFTSPDGNEVVVPAFWAGDNVWKVRFSSPAVGSHHYRTICSDPDNSDLHRREGDVEINPYTGENHLLRHGHLRVSESRRYIEHLDGTPFFWLGDTWWHGLVKRFRWPHDFQLLTADRVTKGFTLIQIVAGLIPELVESRFWEHWSANEAGWAWDRGFKSINPHFFDMADLRIGHLAHSGLVPCIVGAWGYYLQFTGLDAMKKHWRYLVARYGAYPVVWCIAGEVNMPCYDSQRREEDRKEQEEGWTEVARYLRSIDPYHHPVTAHPSFPDSREMVTDEAVVDVDMLQTGHSYTAMERTVQTVIRCVSKTPRMPVVNGEPCYEGIQGGCWQDIQRFCFWTSLLSGSAGHTYGANGIWQFSTRTERFVGVGVWSDVCWEDAYQFPGSGQMGIGRRLLERYRWWEFEPRREPDWDYDKRISPFAAGIPGEVWVMYLASGAIDGKYWGLTGRSIRIEPGAHYHAYFYNPRSGEDVKAGEVKPDAHGQWKIPGKPTREDWVLVMV